MTKMGKPRLKRMRRVGKDLYLTSGIRSIDSKCKVGTRPGMHGAKRTRLSDYAVTLQTKQFVRFSYLISDTKLYKYHLEAVREMRAARKKGKEAGYGLFMTLESRLDVVVRRMGFATTLASARQLISHHGKKGKVFVNGVRQSIPSFMVKPGAVVEVRVDIAKHKETIRAALSLVTETPDWLHVQVSQTEDLFKGTFIRPPNRDELPADLRDSESRVIQIYSK